MKMTVLARPSRVLLAIAVLAAAPHASAQTPGAVRWTNLVNATADGSAVRKTAGCGTCTDAGATSAQSILGGDGYAEFVPVAGARLYAGLGSTTTAATDPALIEFAFSFWPDGGWDVRERNIYRAEGRFTSGDVFRVALESGVARYYKNGTIVYSHAVTVSYPLVLDTTLIGTGAALASAIITGEAAPAPAPVVINTTALSDGLLSQPYSALLSASGGTGAYAWTVTAGALPPGLSVTATGAISGVPSAEGTWPFTVRATDAADSGNFDEQPLAIRIAAPAAVVRIDSTAVPSARLGQAYSASLVASGGSGTYTWSLASGTLPAGLTLSGSGTISGTPSAAGRYSVTVRATDASDPFATGERALWVSVLAATPPSIYNAITDRTARQKPPLPALGAAGFSFTDPAFGSRLTRITDPATRPESPNASYRTPSGTHSNAWSIDGRYFYVTSTDGTPVPFAFDATTGSASRMAAPGGGLLALRFFNEPTFSYVTPGVLYGTATGGDLRSIDAYDIATGAYTEIIDLDALVPTLAGTYTGGLGASAGPTERVMAFFGGTSQDRHFYLVVLDRQDASRRLLLDTLASTVDGVATNITLNFRIHAAAIDRSGRYVTVYPTGADVQAPRSAAPAYVWDIETNTFTATPLVAARSGGHDAYGYGIRVNQDCCTSTTWDAAQWQFRSLAAPLNTTDLITPVLFPKEVYLADHPSWHNAQPVTLVPFLDATYRHGTNTTEWRAWDEEIIAVQTEAAGTGATVWRFAHHRSATGNDTDPTRISFWYTPRVNVSPDGRHALFTSNWEKTLGTDPRGEVGGTFRQDVFLVDLTGSVPVPITPVSIATTAVPGGTAGTPYSAQLVAEGGSGGYNWRIVSGTLPTGLALDGASGAIAGTPAGQGTWTFTVRAEDAADAQNYDDQAFTLVVAAPASSPVNILTTQLPEAKRAVPYSATVERSGGLAPVTWSIAAGSLPPGLSLNPVTGTIAGTPLDNGAWSFTVSVVDSASPASRDTQALTLKVRRR